MDTHPPNSFSSRRPYTHVLMQRDRRASRLDTGTGREDLDICNQKMGVTAVQLYTYTNARHNEYLYTFSPRTTSTPTLQHLSTLQATPGQIRASSQTGHALVLRQLSCNKGRLRTKKASHPHRYRPAGMYSGPLAMLLTQTYVTLGQFR